MLNGLALPTPSGGLPAFPPIGVTSSIGIEFPALVVRLGVDSLEVRPIDGFWPSQAIVRCDRHGQIL